MTLRLATFVGEAMADRLPDLARLCTIVFREWPHLYDGDGTYDRAHLQALATCPKAALIIAYDGEVPVGASTCLPLDHATADIQAPFLEQSWSPARFFYLAESVLLPRYRNQGVGAAFFRIREAHARAVTQCEIACFCTVQRPETHPARPLDARPLDAFWRRRGYAPNPGLHCRMTWKEIGAVQESPMSLMFWTKPL